MTFIPQARVRVGYNHLTYDKCAGNNCLINWKTRPKFRKVKWNKKTKNNLKIMVQGRGMIAH